MKKSIRLVLAFFCYACSIHAQSLVIYEKHLYINNTDTLPYRLLLPENYDASVKYPLVFFMHGAGERGNDNEAQLVHGARLFLQPAVRKQYPAIVVFPQCPRQSFWANVAINRENTGRNQFIFDATAAPAMGARMANELLHEIIAMYPVAKKQLYIGGLSMGGMGTFDLVARNPGLFAAAFPICGGGDPSTARQLKKTKWWIFHGAKDDVVEPVYSQRMVDALKAARAKVTFTLYAEANHNSWDAAFAEPDLLKWLFTQRK